MGETLRPLPHTESRQSVARNQVVAGQPVTVTARGRRVDIYFGPADARGDAERVASAKTRRAEIQGRSRAAQSEPPAGLVMPSQPDWISCEDAAKALGVPPGPAMRGLAERRHVRYSGPQPHHKGGDVMRRGRFARGDVETLAATLAIEAAREVTDADWKDAHVLLPNRDRGALAATVERLKALGVRTRERIAGYNIIVSVCAWDAYRLAGDESPATSRAVTYRRWMIEARKQARCDIVDVSKPTKPIPAPKRIAR